MDSFEAMLQQKHLKRTRARVLILKALSGSLPLTVGEIFEIVHTRAPKLSLSTVYRNCEALAVKGMLLRSTMMNDGLARYEFPHGNHVEHAICLACRKIFPVEVDLEDNYRTKIFEKYGFETLKQRVELYGFCEECRTNGKQKAHLAEEL
ncbi:MAG: Fur family transcriptional regulator [Dialister sp.]|nr:Fur family transcriptional regulator [Dialister sp.]